MNAEEQIEEEREDYFPPVTDLLPGRIGCAAIVTILLLLCFVGAALTLGWRALSQDKLVIDAPVGVVKDGQVMFSGTGEPGAEIELFVRGLSEGTTTVDEVGRWSLSSGYGAPGDYDAEVRYLLGNEEDNSDSVTFTISNFFDADADPTVVANQAGVSADDNSLIQVPFSWSGVGHPGAQVRLLSGGRQIAETDVGPDGIWSFDQNVELAAGSNTLRTLMIWNNRTLLRELRPVSVELPTIGADNQLYSLDLDVVEGAGTSLVPVSVSGQAQPGNDVAIFVDGIQVAIVQAGSAGTWRYSGYLPAGSRTITARVLNSLGDVELVSSDAGIDIGSVTDELSGPEGEDGLLRILFNAPASGDGEGGSGAGGTLASSPAVELIVDASWSMTFPLDSSEEDDRLTVDDPDSRIQIAKAAIDTFIEESLPVGSPVAVRAFGNIEGDLSCRTDLMLELGPVTRDRLQEIIQDIEPQVNANTAIAAALSQVTNDLADTERERVVVLLTDGQETCDGDPGAEIEKLVEQGIETQVNIIGFAITDDALKAQFEEWAALGNGRYIDALDGETLTVALRETLTEIYRVINAADEIVASGVVGGPPIILPPGAYTVQFSSDAGISYDNVVITPGSVIELVRN